MFLWRFFREFSLPCSLVMGALGYLIFANVPFLVPIGDYCGPRLVSLTPIARAYSAFVYNPGSYSAGIAYKGKYRTFVLGFPL